MRYNRSGFTFIELIFVIVIMGFLAKYGSEFLAQAYQSFISSKINHSLQSKSEMAVELISKRLESRIKDSVIAREGEVTTYDAIGNIDPNKSYKVLEWISYNDEGFRGDTKPFWSGVIDLDDSNSSELVSYATETNTTSQLIDVLSYGYSDINDSAIYFIGTNTNIDGYGWDGNALVDQNTSTIHPIKADTTDITKFIPRKGGTQDTNSFKDVRVTEYYKLSWTANAVVIEDYNDTTHIGDLYFYYDYQPWDGEKFYDTGKNIQKVLLMKNVSTFRFLGVGSMMKIQVCAKDNLLSEETYSLCKEKTIY